MSDPLSVAGSAVGIVSLGLVVCGEIVDYGRAYRDFGDDIQSMVTKAESLCVPLNALEEIIKETEVTEPDAAADLSNKIMGINGCVKRIQDALQRYGPKSAPDGFSDKTKDQLKKAVYHFRKHALKDMMADLDSMQITLQTALHVHNLRVAHQIQKTVLILRSGMIPPSLLKQLCDEQTRPRDRTVNSSSIEVSNEKSLIRRKPKPPTRRYGFSNRWLGFAIGLSFNMKFQGGSLSICPELMIQPVIHQSSEIYGEFSRILGLIFGIQFHENRRELGDEIDRHMLELQKKISYREIHPTAIISDQRGDRSLLDWIVDEIMFCLLNYGHFDNVMRFLRFLMDSGATSNPSGWKNDKYIWLYCSLNQEMVHCVTALAEAGINFEFGHDPVSYASFPGQYAKRNLREISSSGYEFIEFAKGLRIILREDPAELKKALEERTVHPNEVVDGSPLLDWASGWPEGVEILLEFGASATQNFISLTRPGKNYHRSARLLLESGCYISKFDLKYAALLNDKGERVRLLVRTLALRREKLRNIAEVSLPSSMLPVSANGGLLDGPDCLEVYKHLAAQRESSSHDVLSRESLAISSYGDTVYHGLHSKRCAEELYKFGFHDTDMLDLNGISPLQSLTRWRVESRFGITEVISWHISKNSDISRKLSWAHETVLHVLILHVVQSCIDAGEQPTSHCHSEIEEQLLFLNDLYSRFNRADIDDHYHCPCAPDGSTVASTILRELTSLTWFVGGESCDKCYRRVFESLYGSYLSIFGDPLGFIRSLTFNALDLTHTCFSNTRKGGVLSRNANYVPKYEDPVFVIHNNPDDDSSLDDFEELVQELSTEFDKVGLPMKEFLEKVWYRRVKDHLLTRHSPEAEAEYIKNAKSVGVELELYGLFVPEWMQVLVAPRVEEVSDEEDFSESE